MTSVSTSRPYLNTLPSKFIATTSVSISDKTFPRRGSIWPHSAAQRPLPWQTCHVRPHRSRVLGVSSAASSARAGGHLMWPPCEPGLSEAPDETPKAPTAPTGQTASKYAPPQQKRQQQPARPDRLRTWGRPCDRQSFGWSWRRTAPPPPGCPYSRPGTDRTWV